MVRRRVNVKVKNQNPLLGRTNHLQGETTKYHITSIRKKIGDIKNRFKSTFKGEIKQHNINKNNLTLSSYTQGNSFRQHRIGRSSMDSRNFRPNMGSDIQI